MKDVDIYFAGKCCCLSTNHKQRSNVHRASDGKRASLGQPHEDNVNYGDFAHKEIRPHSVTLLTNREDSMQALHKLIQAGNVLGFA